MYLQLTNKIVSFKKIFKSLIINLETCIILKCGQLSIYVKEPKMTGQFHFKPLVLRSEKLSCPNRY